MFQISNACGFVLLVSLLPAVSVAQGGGSFVIKLFHSGRISFDADLVKSSAAQIELYAKMGDRLGEAP